MGMIMLKDHEFVQHMMIKMIEAIISKEGQELMGKGEHFVDSMHVLIFRIF